MLGPVVEDAIEGIAGDRTSSASRLARVALETMALATLERPGQRDPATLAEIARRISEAQPAMAIVHNVVHMFAGLVAEGHEPMAVLRQLLEELDTARERIGKTFLKIAPDRATVLTLSYSESVRACLLAAHNRGRIVRVLVMEAGPAFEGRGMAAALGRDGIPAASWPGATMQDLFDLTPGALITTVVTERGTYAPDILRTILAPARSERPPR